jgi:hypothetical protein
VGKGEDGGIPSARSVLVVFVRWSKNLFVISFNFRALCTTIDDYQLIGGFSQKKQKLGVVLGVPSGFLLEQ